MLHPPPPPLAPQIDVLVDGVTEDGELYGRSQWDAPDIDPIVFLTPPMPPDGSGGGAPALPALEIGQMRRCIVVGASLFDLEAVPIA